MPYTRYDVASDARYELVEKKSDAARFRTVPLLETLKTVFPNGDLLSLPLSHQMEIQKVRGGTSVPSASLSSLKTFAEQRRELISEEGVEVMSEGSSDDGDAEVANVSISKD